MSNLFFNVFIPILLPEGEVFLKFLEVPIKRMAPWISAKASGNKCSSGRCQSKHLRFAEGWTGKA